MIEFDQIKQTTEDLLRNLDIDPLWDDFLETPRRVASFWHEFRLREEPVIKVFPSSSTETVTLNNYETWGICPHHLLPVRYNVTISYVPNGKVFGISKLPRIVDYLLKELPLQEDLPRRVVEYIHSKLDVKHAECFVQGMHLCMIMRGIKAKDCTLTTSYKKEGVCQSIK